MSGGVKEVIPMADKIFDSEWAFKTFFAECVMGAEWSISGGFFKHPETGQTFYRYQLPERDHFSKESFYEIFRLWYKCDPYAQDEFERIIGESPEDEQ